MQNCTRERLSCSTKLRGSTTVFRYMPVRKKISGGATPSNAHDSHRRASSCTVREWGLDKRPRNRHDQNVELKIMSTKMHYNSHKCQSHAQYKTRVGFAQPTWYRSRKLRSALNDLCMLLPSKPRNWRHITDIRVNATARRASAPHTHVPFKKADVTALCLTIQWLGRVPPCRRR